MDNRRLTLVALGLSLFAVLDGLVLGVVTGLFLQPPRSNALVYNTDDYVTLVALAYAGDLNLDLAQDRLISLQADPAYLPPLLSEVAARSPGHAAQIMALSRAFELDQAPPVAEAPTLVPTFTPTLVVIAVNAPLSNAPAPASLQSAATPTRTATRAAAPTATPTKGPPTATATRQPSTATPTRRPPTATPTRRPPTATPKATATGAPVPPANGIDYHIKLVRRLTACENGGNHHLFMLVLDAQGNGLANKQVEVVWPSGSTIVVTGQKVENIPTLGINAQTTAGYVNFGMYHGSYRARVLDGVSEQTDWLTVDIPVDEYCPTTDNPQGNSLYHYSYLIVFQRMY